jgi:hypothetical protein
LGSRPAETATDCCSPRLPRCVWLPFIALAHLLPVNPPAVQPHGTAGLHPPDHPTHAAAPTAARQATRRTRLGHLHAYACGRAARYCLGIVLGTLGSRTNCMNRTSASVPGTMIRHVSFRTVSVHVLPLPMPVTPLLRSLIRRPNPTQRGAPGFIPALLAAVAMPAIATAAHHEPATAPRTQNLDKFHRIADGTVGPPSLSTATTGKNSARPVQRTRSVNSESSSCSTTGTTAVGNPLGLPDSLASCTRARQFASFLLPPPTRPSTPIS